MTCTEIETREAVVYSLSLLDRLLRMPEASSQSGVLRLARAKLDGRAPDWQGAYKLLRAASFVIHDDAYYYCVELADYVYGQFWAPGQRQYYAAALC